MEHHHGLGDVNRLGRGVLEGVLRPPLTDPAVTIGLSDALLVVSDSSEADACREVLVGLRDDKALGVKCALIALDVQAVDRAVLVETLRDDRQLRGVKIVVGEVKVDQSVVV